MIATLPRYRLLLGAGALLVVALLCPFPRDSNAGFWDTLMDAAHVPVFALVTALLWATNPAGFVSRKATLAFAAFAALAFAALIEVAQHFTGRLASMDDWTKGAAGIAAATLVLAGWRIVGSVAGLAAFVIVLEPPLKSARGIVWREMHFPVLGDFESQAELGIWHPPDRDQMSTYHRPRIVRGHATRGAHSLHVRIVRLPWHGVRLLCGDKDWSPYKTLAFDIENPGKPFTVALRIDDAASTDSTNRYNSAIEIAPGKNSVSLALDEVARQPKGRPLDLSRIRRLVFFSPDYREDYSYYLDNVRLE